MTSLKLSRRKFMELTVAVAMASVAGTFADGLDSLGAGVVRASVPVKDAGRLRVARTACIICGQKCPLKITVEGGSAKVWSIAYNYDPREEDEYATCGRPQTIFEASVLPQRIKKPLKRVGERGSGEFEEISWEEALDIVASKLKECKPDEMIVFRHQGYDSGLVATFFEKVLGVPNVTNHSDTCHRGLDYAGWWVFGKMQGPGAYRPDYKHARLVVFMGRNPLAGIVATPWTKTFSEGRRKGLRIIVFDVRESRLTQLADKYYIIPPGTDLAASLAILHVIIKESLYNEEYLRTYTNASMLVYADTLEPVGLRDHPSWKDKKTYMVVDEVDGKVKFKNEASKPALSAQVEIDGRRAVTALDLLWEAVKDYTPEWAEKITGILASEIKWVARQLAENAPRAFIDPGYKASRYKNEGMKNRANLLINTLLGSIGAKGGVAWPRKVKLKNPLSIVGIKPRKPVGKPLYKYWEKQGYTFISSKGYSQLAIKSILEEKPRKIKMVFIFNENLVSHMQGSKAVIDALKKVDFVVVADCTFNETVLYADLVLPLTMYFEQSAPTLFSPSKTGKAQVVVIEKALDPPEGVGAKPGWWLVKELGKRLDPGNAKKYEALSRHEEIWKKQAEDLKIDLGELMKKGVVTLYKEPIYHPLKGKYLPTVTGEIELVNVKGLKLYKGHARKESHYNPLLVWMPPRWMAKRGGGLAENEFVAVDTTHRLTATNMWIRFTRLSGSTLEWEGRDGVAINRGRAEKLGIRDGDLVRIIGPGGNMVARARLRDDVHSLVVLAPHATNAGALPTRVRVRRRNGIVEIVNVFNAEWLKGINTNMLSSFDIVAEEGGRAAQCDVIVRIEKVGGGA